MSKKMKSIETWPVERLRPYERQAANFRDVSPAELKRLMDVMSTGKYDPIEVTPDGRILDGHQRHRAAIALDWEVVKVQVRHDLADDEVAIEVRHLQANA